MADTLREYRLTDHAKFEMHRRQISETEVALVLESPQQVQTVREGRKICQSKFEMEEPSKDDLMRVVVDIDHRRKLSRSIARVRLTNIGAEDHEGYL